MNNSLKDIPEVFLKNLIERDNKDNQIYIASADNIKISNQKKNDNIWLILIFAIIFDLI